jgi:hypothetical protein
VSSVLYFPFSFSDKICGHISYICPIRAIFPANLVLHQIIPIMYKEKYVQIMKLLITHFSLLLPLRPTYPPQYPQSVYGRGKSKFIPMLN